MVGSRADHVLPVPSVVLVERHGLSDTSSQREVARAAGARIAASFRRGWRPWNDGWVRDKVELAAEVRHARSGVAVAGGRRLRI